MMTIISYARAKYGGARPPLRLVWAGHEPQDFVNFFPEWSLNNLVARTNQEVTAVCKVQDEPPFLLCLLGEPCSVSL